MCFFRISRKCRVRERIPTWPLGTYLICVLEVVRTTREHRLATQSLCWGPPIFSFSPPSILLFLFSCLAFLPAHIGIYLVRRSLLFKTPFETPVGSLSTCLTSLLLQFYCILLNRLRHSNRTFFVGEVTSRVSVLFIVSPQIQSPCPFYII